MLVSPVSAQEVASKESTANYQKVMERTQWWREARFGMFIHFGAYAVPARGEWVKTNEHLTTEQYQKYVDEFNPTNFDAKAWARTAKAAGMKYAVLTAKHHDGYCMYDSKFTDYKLSTRFDGRDLVREFLDAFRAEGIKVGLYYSLLDWHHSDYPVEGNCVVHPMNGVKGYSNEGRDFSKYITYMHNQVRELLTNYGKIDILWLDFSCGEMTGEKWEATKLVEMVRTLQPKIIIDNRLGGNMELENPEPYAGDFESPEQVIPHKGIFDKPGRPIPWEACISLNNDWGYSTNQDYKSAKDVIQALVNVVSKGGNLLLNVGPDAKGNIPKWSLEVLSEVGSWLDLNGESIYGCGPAPFPKPEWGRYTMRNDKLYAHILGSNIGQYYMKGMKGKVENAQLVPDGRQVFIGPYWHGERSYIDEVDIFFNLGNPPQWTFPVPDKINTVVKFELTEE
ncbi:alpha-L-fucosidase [bacterium]|nr:alpha-L-fucosidase [bacterium]